MQMMGPLTKAEIEHQKALGIKPEDFIVTTADGQHIGNMDCFRAMTAHDNPQDLSDHEVVLIVMWSDDRWTFTTEEYAEAEQRSVDRVLWNRAELKKKKDADRKHSNNQGRSKRAGRTDISRETRAKLKLPSGWRWKENAELSQKQKLAMTRSFLKSEERSTQRAILPKTSSQIRREQIQQAFDATPVDELSWTEGKRIPIGVSTLSDDVHTEVHHDDQSNPLVEFNRL